jgi:hypothetical protein
LDLLEKSQGVQDNLEEITDQNQEQIEGTSHAIEVIDKLIERSNAHYQNNTK